MPWHSSMRWRSLPSFSAYHSAPALGPPLFFWGNGNEANGGKGDPRGAFFLKSPYCWWLKSGLHQLRLVVEIPLFTRDLYIHPRWLFGISSINSTTRVCYRRYVKFCRCLHFFVKKKHHRICWLKNDGQIIQPCFFWWLFLPGETKRSMKTTSHDGLLIQIQAGRVEDICIDNVWLMYSISVLYIS